MFLQSYLFKDHRTYVKSENSTEYVNLCEEFRVVEIYIDSLTGYRYDMISVFYPDGTSASIRIPRSEVVSRGIIAKLAGIGLSLPDDLDFSSVVSEILIDSESTAVKKYYHTKRGFYEDFNGKTSFFGLTSLDTSFESYYVDYNSINPQGTSDDWLNALKPYISESPKLQLALCIGLSAPINAILQNSGIITEIPIYTIVGKSSTGKTTALRLMASMWTKPTVGIGISHMNDTANYISAKIAQNRGYPNFFDDVSANLEINLTQLIYSVSSSSSRGRCDSNGDPKPVQTFSGSVVFTSENSIFSQTNGQSGLYARVIEFYCSFFSTKEKAEAVSKQISATYGTAWKPLMALIIEKGDKLLEFIFQRVCTFLDRNLKSSADNNIKNRTIKKYAVLMTAIPYLERIFGFKFDSDKIFKLIERSFARIQATQTPEEELYDKILSEVVAKRSMFPDKNGKFDMTISALGEVSEYNQIPCVWINKQKFEEMLTNFGAKDTRAACKMLYNAKYLAHFGDRYYTTHKIGKIPTKCCAVYISDGSIKATPQKTEVKHKNLLD